MIRATTDSEKSNITLHVCHCDQSVTVNDEPRGLIQGIEKIAERLGRVDEVPEPQAGGRDKNETDVAGCGFVVSGREPAALFEF